MVIANARVAESANEWAARTIEIPGGSQTLDLRGHLLLPGLINAHDHLEFNLFPRLGRRIYANAGEWAADIHRTDQSPVREHLRVPKETRLFWGGMKNLLSGVTTVAHHNPYEQSVFDDSFPVRVLRRFGWAHSLGFSPDISTRYRNTPPDQPFIVHAGEGTDECAREEIYRLEQQGLLGSRTVLVHGLGFDDAGLELVAQRGASLVWCPSSNLLTYGRTLRPERATALGTDSAISAAGDMIDELQVAHRECGASPEKLYGMVTQNAARILRTGAAADLVAVEDRGQTPAEALLNLHPELVVVAGHLHLISEQLAMRLKTADFHWIHLEGRGSWLTPFNVPEFLQSAQNALGPEIRLAGRRVTA
jgi:cytosine/adenosine deaminase-related metal-dependent hydrolase